MRVLTCKVAPLPTQRAIRLGFRVSATRAGPVDLTVGASAAEPDTDPSTNRDIASLSFVRS